MSNKRNKSEWELVELPGGFRTSFGYWYTMTTEGIESYVPGLLKLYPVEHLVRIADDWLRSREQLPALVFMLLVYSPLSISITLVLGSAFYLLWRAQLSAFIYPWGHPGIRWICENTLLYIAFIGGLSYDSVALEGWVQLGLSSLEITTLIGSFLLIKTGLISMVLHLLNVRFSSEYSTAITDRVLNMVLIRYGYKEGLLTGNLKTMQDKFIRVANYHQTRKKNKS
tara:strand:- start:2221 stop:2898 length:678 start_codon:yes stop_codon:yes gene_type:complete